jgi:large subunit ribosomal protein L10
MALNKEQKQKSLKSLKEKISKGPEGAPSMVFADFSKVASKDLFSLRNNLKKSGCDMKIGKKTLMRIAFGQLGFSFWKQIKKIATGQLALILGAEDEIAPARLSNEFAKKNENFKILGGIFENKFIDRERVLALAAIPPRNELLAKLVGSISSPIASFVRVLNKIANKN